MAGASTGGVASASKRGAAGAQGQGPPGLMACTPMVPPRSWLSRLSLDWIGGVIWKMHRGTFNEADWPQLDPNFSSEVVAKQALLLWEKELANPKGQSAAHTIAREVKTGSVRHVLWQLIGGRVILGFSLAALRGALEQGLLPLLVRECLLVATGTSVAMGRIMALAIPIVLCRIAELTTESWAFNMLLEECCPIGSAAVSALVLHKAGSAQASVPEAKGLGPQVLLGVDLPRFLGRLPLTVMAASSIGGFTSGIVLMFVLLGPVPAALGLAWVLLLVGVATFMRGRQTMAERPMSEVTAGRMKVLSTMLSTIRGVKLFAWEDRYFESLSRLREKELHYILRLNCWWFSGSVVGKAVPITTPLIAFASFAMLGNQMSLADVFAANTIFVQFRRNVDTLAIGVSIMKTFSLTLERVQNYMNLPEQPPRRALQWDPSVKQAPVAVVPSGQITYTAREGDQAATRGFSLDLGLEGVCIRPGELVAVCGRVGQGKSTLLGAIAGALADCCRLEGGAADAACVADLAYVPQKAFVLSGTIRENLVMCESSGTLKNSQQGSLDDRIVGALLATALAADISGLPNGLSEEVGERGTTLSGGQQARVNLARALIREPQLLVADDPLAAVDSKVALTLFCSIRRFIAAEPDRRAAVLAVNQSYLLKNFDRVIFVDEGRIVGQGTFDQLCAQCPAFTRFMAGIELVVIAPSNWSPKPIADGSIGGAAATARQSCRQMVLESSTPEAIARGRGQLLKVEAVPNGQEVPLFVWLRYAKLAGAWTAAAMIFAQALTWVCQGTRDWWLVVWSEASEAGEDAGYYIGVYAALCGSQMLLHVLGAILTIKGCIKASRTLHSESLSRLLRAPVSFFEETPMGRLMSRFGTDLSQLDTQVSVFLESAVQMVLMLLMFAAAVTVRLPWMLPAFVWSTICFWFPCKAGFRTRLAAKRLGNAAMGPLFSNLAEMEQGRALIRAMDLHQFFFARHCSFHDETSRFNTLGVSTMNFGRFAVDASNVLLTGVVAAALLAAGIERGDASVALSYTIFFGMFLLICNMVFSQIFTWGSNVERMLDIMHGNMPEEVGMAQISSEKNVQGGALEKLLNGEGAIEFREVSLRYREGLPLALHSLSLKIPGGTRVGIIGRTGAGKSTFISCLFRLVDRPLLTGTILLDGIDTHSLDLKSLRRAISMIPQDPVLMDGTVRFNLDPFDEFSDDALAKSLAAAYLPALKLDVSVASEGSLSAGERQLLCFARALLLRRRVLVADEPTASIDMRTDALVQDLLRDAFAGSTVLTVAHRIQTILDYDRILVMDKGKLAEDGPPGELLRRPSSLFAQYLAAGRDGNAPGSEETGASSPAISPAARPGSSCTPSARQLFSALSFNGAE
mmetsp:Transcript_23475/g.79585  ORF Transcript_23475/g.79585 Transcript_23475/m.79585 type:complete len:1371 (+) Transcript_23475:72-4184(+)